MDISRALTIDGWMTPVELTWLAEQASKHTKIVEVGSYKGRSTRALADNTEGEVYALDDWFGPKVANLTESEREKLFDEFKHNLSDYLATGRVIPLQGEHSSLGEDLSPDFVFIDGSHDYESVKRDIRNWKSRLQPGGLLSGHDYSYPDVLNAVRDFLPGYKVADSTQIWYVEMPGTLPPVKRIAPKTETVQKKK